MFDIGFTELLMIGVVALIVIGPERLPKVARTAGHLYGRMQRYVSTVKSDISREIDLDELQRAGQQFKESVHSTVSDVQQQGTVVDDFLRNETGSIGKELTAAVSDEEPGTSAPAKPHTPPSSASSRQHSLPLGEPDQNVHPAPAAVVETVQRSSTGKSA